MYFSEEPEHIGILRDTIARFVGAEMPKDKVREWDRAHTFPPELFRKLGHAFPGYIERGLYLAVLATDCRYHSPARYDDVVSIHAAIESVGRARLKVYYELRSAEGTLLVTGSTEHAILDDDGRPQRMPQDLREAVIQKIT